MNVSAVKRKDTSITLSDGVERHLKFDLNALAEIEDKFGTVDAGFEELDKGSIKAVRFILWAGLVHEDENLTEQKVGSLIDIQYLQEIMNSMGSAMQNDLPEKTNASAQPKVVALNGSNPN